MIKYNLKHITDKQVRNKTKKELRKFLSKNNWSKNCIACLFKTNKCYGWTLTKVVTK